MTTSTKAPPRASFLRRTRHRIWAAIGLCLIARTADAALGLHLIEPMDASPAQEAPREPNAKDIQP
jgi:hypothetical protein